LNGKLREAREAEQAGKEEDKETEGSRGVPKTSFRIFLICFFCPLIVPWRFFCILVFKSYLFSPDCQSVLCSSDYILEGNNWDISV